jgi:hypothetical protein
MIRLAVEAIDGRPAGIVVVTEVDGVGQRADAMLVVIALWVIAGVIIFSLLRGPVSSDKLLVDVVIGAP